MKWNYRIVRSQAPTKQGDLFGNQDWLSIQEVYYDEDGKPHAQTTDLQIEGENIEELGSILEGITNAFKKPVINEIPSDSYNEAPSGQELQLELFPEAEEERTDEWRIEQYNRNRGPEEWVTTIKEMEDAVEKAYNPDYLYESPDGGKTIYRRKSGSSERKIVEDV